MLLARLPRFRIWCKTACLILLLLIVNDETSPGFVPVYASAFRMTKLRNQSRNASDRIASMRKIALCLASLLAAVAPAFAKKTMKIYLIDVEGGQSTLFVSPQGESLLVDTGWPGNAYRDANRIVKAAKLAGVKKIDYLLITHYHVDHVGGVPQLVTKLPVHTFIDHGPNRDDPNSTRVGYDDYAKAMGGSQ